MGDRRARATKRKAKAGYGGAPGKDGGSVVACFPSEPVLAFSITLVPKALSSSADRVPGADSREGECAGATSQIRMGHDVALRTSGRRAAVQVFRHGCGAFHSKAENPCSGPVFPDRSLEAASALGPRWTPMAHQEQRAEALRKSYRSEKRS